MAEEIKKVNEELNQEQEVNQENTTPETKTEAEEKKDEPKKEGILSKFKKFGSTKVVPAAKAVGRVAGKMAIITGGVLGAAATIGFVAGLSIKNQNEDEDEENAEEESVSGGDEEIDELLNEDDSDEDSEDEDSAEE